MKGYSLSPRTLQNNQSQIINIDLQMNLLNTWNKHQVPEYYQDIFLPHLDELNPKAAQAKIKKQIANTIQKRSHYYMLQHADQQRQNLIRQLQPYLYLPSQQVTMQELSLMCDYLRQLRDVNLLTAQTILKMRQEYKCLSSQADTQQLTHYNKLITNLQEQVEMVRNSCLRDFIPLKQGFDPFFMDYYEFCHRQNGYVQQPIKQLYSMNISYVYRLMRIKDQLLDLKSSNRQSSFHFNKERQSRIRSLPTYGKQLPSSEYFHINKQSPTKIYPVTVIRGQGDRSSRTTMDPLRAERIETSYTEDYSKDHFKFKKVFRDMDGSRSKKSRVKKYNHYALSEQRQRPRKRHEIHSTEQFLLASRAQDYIMERPKRQLQQESKEEQDIQKDLSKLKTNLHLKPIEKKITYQLIPQPEHSFGTVKHYNPIKKDSFEVLKAQAKSNKYDYNPSQSNSLPRQDQDQQGFNYEEPIPRMFNKNKYMIHKKSFTLHPPVIQPQQVKPSQKILKTTEQQTERQKIEQKTSPAKNTKVSRQIQTLEQPQNNQATIKKGKVEVRQPIITKKEQPNKKKLADSDQVVEDEDIIDERPIKKKTEPLIRVLEKQKPPINPQPSSNKFNQSQSNSKEQKKQIKMRIGKSTIKQMVSSLQKLEIQSKYKSLFDLQKLNQWVRLNQTYLVQFYLNDACAVIALCSPIAGIGMALKLWAPIDQSIDFTMSNNLFTKYIEFIQKSTTGEKIMFSGDGELFKELAGNDFKMKKQKLYQRLRKVKSTKQQSQFEPFLYIQCSTVNFKQTSKQSMIYSQQIEQFSNDNYLIAPFLQQVGSNIPEQLKSFVKTTDKVANFAEVNKILQKEGFDEYEASQIKVNNIDLLRFYLNSPLKSCFVANQGMIRLNGALLHEKDNQCLIGVSITKNNGNTFFSKNMTFEAVAQKSKKPPGSKVWFWVKMFTKKLYGRLIKSPPGYYANWEINLTWEDQMQGKIKHTPQPGQRIFGNQKFNFCIEVQKRMIYGVTVDKDDFIY